MKRLPLLIAFVLFTLAGGTLIGMLNGPGEWYRALDKPVFNPPDWVFGPVWTVLYILVGIAGARTFARRPAGLAMQVWFAQLALNFAWTPAFFTLESLPLALAIALAMLAAILFFIRLTWRTDRLSAVLFIPYAVWVAFAALLNATLWQMNA